MPIVVVASDGQGGETSDAGAGYLLADVSPVRRVGACWRLSQLLKIWPAAENHIQIIECLAVILGLIDAAEFLAGRSVLWFIDHSSVLGALVKGKGEDAMEVGGLEDRDVRRLEAFIKKEYGEGELVFRRRAP